MIKINLATKPGLQDESENKLTPGSHNDIFTLSPSAAPPSPSVPPAPVNDQLPEGPHDEMPLEMPDFNDDIFKSVEANLQMLEQAEAEEFVPRHVSLPPEKLEEVDKEKAIENLTQRPIRRRLVKLFSYLIVFAIIGYGGYWAYNKYLKTPMPAIVIPAETQDAFPVEEQPVAVEPSPVITETPAPEYGQPVNQSPAANVPEVRQPVQQPVTQRPVAHQPVAQQIINQVEEIYIRQILTGTGRSQILAQVIGAIPASYRLQYLKMKSEKISFLIYVNSEEEARRIKTAVENIPGLFPPDVFYIERMASVAAPSVQIMAILKLRNQISVPMRNIRFQNDVELSQTLWAIGKRNQVTLSPLSITEPPGSQPRLAEISGSASLSGFSSLLRDLLALDLNLSIEQISLSPGRDYGSIDFSLNSVLFPQKM